MNYSVTYIGLITNLLGWLFTTLDITVAPRDLDIFIKVVWIIFTGLLAFWGRYRLGDISWSGFRLKRKLVNEIDVQ